MKTVKSFQTFVIILMLILISGISSYAGKTAIASAVHIRKVLKESVKYPEQAVKKCCTGSVDVIFTVDDAGKIQIKKTFAENPELEKMVKEQLSSINCKGIESPSTQQFRVTIAFRLIGELFIRPE